MSLLLRSERLVRTLSRSRLRPQSLILPTPSTPPTTATPPPGHRALSRTASRQSHAMDSQSCPFTQMVVKAMQELYPEQLADKSFDNVGLLVENVGRLSIEPRVLLTNDVTDKVAREAIQKKVSVIVSYHPFIFRGLKSITLSDPLQKTLLELVKHNIAVYCPHTAVDAAPGGNADWLADKICAAAAASSSSSSSPTPAERSVVIPSPSPPPGFEGAGMGRLVHFAEPTKLSRVVRALADGLGGLRYLSVATPRRQPAGEPRADPDVHAVAVCAGAGGDIIGRCGDADVLVTGEMAHHVALAAVQRGQTVITTFHSNSERLFLRERMQPALQERLSRFLVGPEVLVSEDDEDPFEVWDTQNLREWLGK